MILKDLGIDKKEAGRTQKALTDAQIKQLEEEIEKRDAVIQEYTKIVKAIEEEYAENRRVLEDRNKKEVKKLVEEYVDKPDELAKMIGEKFGFSYVGE